MSLESHNAVVLADLQFKLGTRDHHGYGTDDHADRFPIGHWRPWFLDSQEDFLVKLRLASGFLRRYCLVELERRAGHDTYARFGPLSCR